MNKKLDMYSNYIFTVILKFILTATLKRITIQILIRIEFYLYRII